MLFLQFWLKGEGATLNIGSLFVGQNKAKRTGSMDDLLEKNGETKKRSHHFIAPLGGVMLK